MKNLNRLVINNETETVIRSLPTRKAWEKYRRETFALLSLEAQYFRN
jgi:uncharacterized protein YjiS (DUF1127 family)